MATTGTQHNKFALITGGTRGIGFGIAKKLAESGHDLILGYGANHERAEKAKQELASTFGTNVFTVAGDVAEEETINAFFDAVKTHFGDRLNVFVHNAGLYLGKTSSPKSALAINAVENPGFQTVCDGNTSFSTYDYYQSVYPKCFIRCVERALPLMKDGDGYVIAISSPGCNATTRPTARYVPGPSKAVLEHLVRNYAIQLAPRRITCNCIIPGLTRTEAAVIGFGNGDEEKLEEFGAHYCPMKALVNPVDIGEAVAFLCSSKASFITGVAINIDGGARLK